MNERTTVFKVADRNYRLLSETQKEVFRHDYLRLFRHGYEFDWIIVSDNNSEPFRTIYLALHEDDESRIRQFQCDLHGITHFFSETDNIYIAETAMEDLFHDKPYDTLECFFDKAAEDDFIPKLTTLTTAFTRVPAVTKISFRPIEDKVQEVRLAFRLASKLGEKIRQDVISNGDRLYRVSIEVTTLKEHFACIKKYVSEEFGITLKSGISRTLGLHSEFAGIYTPDVYKNLIPFYSAEVCDTGNTAFYYGDNQITKNPLQYDRRHSRLANGIITGISGSGKSCFVKSEIMQVLEKTEDDIIIIDPAAEYARASGLKNREFVPDVLCDCLTDKMKRIDLWSGDYHINLLDIIIDYPLDNTGREAVSEKADMIIGFIEGLLPKWRECNVHECDAVIQATHQVMDSFVSDLISKQKESNKSCGCIYDFQANPTFKEVFDTILQNNDEHISELKDTLTARKPYLERFFYKTDIPECRGLVLGLDSVPCKFEPAFYTAAVSYISRRIYLNRIRMIQEHSDKHLWVYFDEAHQLFCKSNHFADFAMSVYKRSRMNGAICTAISHSLSDLGQAIVNNSGFLIFLTAAPADREQMQRLFNMSDEMLEYVYDRFSGDGIFYNNAAMIPFFRKNRLEIKHEGDGNA